MTDQEFADKLLELFGEEIDKGTWEGEPGAEPPIIPISEVADFADAGFMCMNPGLVVTLDDGSEFQLQIVRSN